MKITALKDNLLMGVSAVQKAVSTKNTLPILTCIKIEAKNNMLYFFGTDLEMGIQIHVPAEVIFEGVTVVPARHFIEIVRKLPSSLITLHLTGENELSIQYENSQLTLRTLSSADFPALPEVLGDYEIHIQASLFKQMIKQTAFSAGTDEGRPLFTGILFETENDKIRMIATDTHRLALRQGVPKSQPESPQSFIIPAKMLSEIARLIYDEEEICRLSLTKNVCVFTISNIVIICRLLDGQFPNYRQVIPNQYKSKVEVKTKSILEAVERISLFTIGSDNSNTIQLSINDTIMTISSQSELGQGYEQLPVENEGEAVIISFNARYLLDAFKTVEAEKVVIEFTGPLSPCIMRPGESENLFYLILPVRT